MGLRSLPVAAATETQESVGTTLANATNVSDTFATSGSGVIASSAVPGISGAVANYEVGDTLVGTFSSSQLDSFGAFVGDFVLLTARSGSTTLFQALAQETGFTTDNPIFGTTENVSFTIRQIIVAKSNTTVPTSITVANRTASGITSQALADFGEGDNLALTFTPATLTAAGINAVNQRVRITTTPSQFVGEGTVSAINTTTGAVTVNIAEVTTARTFTNITGVHLALITASFVTPLASSPITEGGYIVGFYQGDTEVRSHRFAQRVRFLTITFGDTGATTTYDVQNHPRAYLGAQVPAGSTITNYRAEAFNLVLNSSYPFVGQ